MKAQTWLDQNYPLEKRGEITELTINSLWAYEGSLKLERFVNLKKLNCSGNKITDLDLRDCPNLEELDCFSNQLTSLDFCLNHKLKAINIGNNQFIDTRPFQLLAYPKRVIELDISQNNFKSQTLDFLAPFTNLERLDISNFDQETIEKGIYNCFYGSLKPLEYMKSLRTLLVQNTDIDSGLEYLPLDNLDIFGYFDNYRPNCGIKKIHDLLGKQGERGKLSEQAASILRSIQGEKKNNQLQKEHLFYKNFFDNHFQSKKTELTELKSKLNKEELE